MRRLHGLLWLVMVVLVTVLTGPASVDDKDTAGDKDKTTDLPVVEATIPETLHPMILP